MDQKNYIPIDCHIPFMNRYAYLDDETDHAFRLFEKNNCNVHISHSAYEKNGTDFIIRLCLIRKKQDDLFLKIMDELDRNLSVIRGREYTETKNTLFNALYEGHEELLSEKNQLKY